MFRRRFKEGDIIVPLSTKWESTLKILNYTCENYIKVKIISTKQVFIVRDTFFKRRV